VFSQPPATGGLSASVIFFEKRDVSRFVYGYILLIFHRYFMLTVIIIKVSLPPCIALTDSISVSLHLN